MQEFFDIYAIPAAWIAGKILVLVVPLIVRVAMLGTSFGMVVDKAVTFAPPSPVVICLFG